MRLMYRWLHLQQDRAGIIFLSIATGVLFWPILQEWPHRNMTTAVGGCSMFPTIGPSKAIFMPAIRLERVEERCQEA